jgi:hypothetical protein
MNEEILHWSERMKINKAFTDYYDWVEQLDPIPNDVVYVRTPMVQPNPLDTRTRTCPHLPLWKTK